ncbi:acyl carrier protein [Micromonospora halophytica]|uniref:Acyl carrier protein n=1 Tax=Micromonospora halophytica TaxID=47864 RepID=A0A1C5I6V7_9ACTN|nr:acyl carrier protein [Micromonospora halophytica]SCG53943.1 acyl carrier protein [Micromonospora halophytica]
MQRAELAEVVRERVAGVLGVPVEEIDESTDLRQTYGVDSLELMEIGARLENSLNTRLAAEDLLGMENIGNAIDLLHERLRERP